MDTSSIGIKTIEGENAAIVINFFGEELKTLLKEDGNIKISIDKENTRVYIRSKKSPKDAENRLKEITNWCNSVVDDVFKVDKGDVTEIKKVRDYLENNAVFFTETCVKNAVLFRMKTKTKNRMAKWMQELRQLTGRETPSESRGVEMRVLEGAQHSLLEDNEGNSKQSMTKKDERSTGARQKSDNSENKTKSIAKNTTNHTLLLDEALKNGLRFMVYVKDIRATSVDAIVNPANEDLDNLGGCAREISVAAGKQFEDECRRIVSKKGKIKVTENVISTPGKLPYRCIINAVGPQWKHYDLSQKTKCLDDLERTITKILMTSERENLKSIAIPPISSGIFGVPEELCAAMYVTAIVNFKRAKKLEIHLVDISAEILDLICRAYDAFRKNPYILDPKVVLRNYEAKLLKEGQKEKKRDSKDQDKDFNRCKHIGIVDKKHLFIMTHEVKIFIYKGDLVKLRGIGTLVSAENVAFTGSGALARSILQHAGLSYKKDHDKIQNDTSKNKRLSRNSSIALHAGKLEYRFVIHAIVSRFDSETEPNENELVNLRNTTYRVLDHAKLLSLNEKKSSIMDKVAMPLLGAGAITKPRILELMCRYVYYGIEDFLCHNTGIIKEIHLVSFNEGTYQAFLKVFLDFSADEFRNSRECPPTKRPLSASMREKKEKWQACAPAAIWKMEEQNQSDTDLKNHVRKPLPNADDDNCIICLNAFENPIEFKKCHHAFCQDCIGEFFSLKPVCPICNTVYGKIYGDQPKTGTATIYKEQTPLPGEKCRETWVIFYDFPDGCQEECHPNPKHPYKGTRRVAYLPASEEGTIVLHMLEKAFKQGLTFTIGFSRTTGRNNVVTWNDIHHKTNTTGGPERFGYPDPSYLLRVKEELEAKGITAEVAEEKAIDRE